MQKLMLSKILTLSFSISCSCISLLSSCSTSTLKIESQPEGADVFISIEGQTTRKIGVTPLLISENQVNSGNNSFQISVLKDGYVTENVLAPATTFTRSTSVQIKLKEKNNSKSTNMDDALQRVSSQIALSIEFIKNKDYMSAERNLLDLRNQYSNVATIHELLGNVYYLRKDLSRAYGSYKKAMSLNPNNLDTKRMIDKIEGIRSDLKTNASVGEFE